MENLRLRSGIQLVHTRERARKLTGKSSFKRFEVFNRDLIGVENMLTQLNLCKPIYVGQAILDLSKTIIYDFHYNFIKNKYNEKATLLFSDTDSLTYSINTQIIYEDIYENSELFDLSNYPKDHFLYNNKNARKPGTFKDETKGVPIQEFAGLRSKMYSIKFGNLEQCKAKGIANATIKHNHYKECLFNRKDMKSQMDQIRSKQHTIYSIKTTKISLSAFDDKRFISDCGIKTYAYGHRAITS